jgi:hypothetical protein
MDDYRAYIIGKNGHITEAIELSCENDKAAIEKVKQLAKGRDTDLWQFDRQITKLQGRQGLNIFAASSPYTTMENRMKCRSMARQAPDDQTMQRLEQRLREIDG